MRNATPEFFGQAVCKGLSGEMFYPDDGEKLDPAPAKAVCMTCPVQSECLIHAITTHEKYGVWGGLTDRERRKFRRLIGWKPIIPRRPCGTYGGFQGHVYRGERPCIPCLLARRAYKADARAKERRKETAVAS